MLLKRFIAALFPESRVNIDPTWEVHPADVKTWLQGAEPFLLLDVRQQKEWDTAHIPGARLVPLDQLERQADSLAEWKNRRVVVHCQKGGRSLKAAALLRAKGFANVHSMAGGIEAWSPQIDLAVKRT